MRIGTYSQVCCSTCDSTWAEMGRQATQYALGTRDQTADQVVRDCLNCVGTYRNPIPWAEVMGGMR